MGTRCPASSGEEVQQSKDPKGLNCLGPGLGGTLRPAFAFAVFPSILLFFFSFFFSF